MSTYTHLPRFKLVFFTPPAALPAIKKALFAAGAGTYPGGKYVQCCFESPGTGQFLPVKEAGAKPAIGTPDQLERVDELRVEVLCVGERTMKDAVAGLKK